MHRRRSKLGEPGGMLPPKKIINLGSPETPIPTFSTAHIKQINKAGKCSSPLFFLHLTSVIGKIQC